MSEEFITIRSQDVPEQLQLINTYTDDAIKDVFGEFMKYVFSKITHIPVTMELSIEQCFSNWNFAAKFPRENTVWSKEALEQEE